MDAVQSFFATPLEKSIEDATHADLPDVDWAKNMEVHVRVHLCVYVYV
jgi:hypothetical protein